MIFVDQADEPRAADHALAQMCTGFDHLLKVLEDGGLDEYGDHEFVGFLQGLEQLRNKIPLLDHKIITDGVARDLPGTLLQSSMTRVLSQALRLSPVEANRRVRAAEQVGGRVSMLGQPLDPVRPHLAAAQRRGDVTPEQVHIVQRALASVDRAGFDPADIAAGEVLLTDFAAQLGPKELKLCADRVVDAINPDGSKPQDQLNADRRHFNLRQTSDGAYCGEFRLTAELGAKLQAVLGPLAKPRTGKVTHADGTTTEEVDTRTYGQRMHDALEDVCDRLLRSDILPESGGTPATVIVTITLEDLLERLGFGRTSDGALIPTDQLLRMANQADLIPTVLSKAGKVLAMGRSRRVATVTQTLGLIARDVGCSFPGCDRSASWCERHHIKEWVAGGLTDLDNLTLLCRYHHHNFASRGWTCRLNTGGLPEWTPPRWVDRDQKPLINSRIIAQQLIRNHERRRP